MSPTLAKYLKADYIRWVLVQLPSGRWATVAHDALEDDALCESIVREDAERFQAARFPSQYDALKAIVDELEREAAVYPLMAEFFEPEIRRAKADLARLAPKVEEPHPDSVRLDFLCQNTHLRLRQHGAEWVVWNARDGLEMVASGPDHRTAIDAARAKLVPSREPDETATPGM